MKLLIALALFAVATAYEFSEEWEAWKKVSKAVLQIVRVRIDQALLPK